MFKENNNKRNKIKTKQSQVLCKTILKTIQKAHLLLDDGKVHDKQPKNNVTGMEGCIFSQDKVVKHGNTFLSCLQNLMLYRIEPRKKQNPFQGGENQCTDTMYLRLCERALPQLEIEPGCPCAQSGASFDRSCLSTDSGAKVCHFFFL